LKVLCCATIDHLVQVPKGFDLIIVLFIVRHTRPWRDRDVLERTIHIHIHMTIIYLFERLLISTDRKGLLFIIYRFLYIELLIPNRWNLRSNGIRKNIKRRIN
jgi:hypothetical protein